MSIDLTKTNAQDSLSLDELDLYHRITAYRDDFGLAPLPLSKALTTTAGRHVVDTRENIWAADLDRPRGANLHSWSDAPYYADGRDPRPMWDAPERLRTGYTSPGYEISAAGYTDSAEALDGWQGSPGHDAVLTNTGGWSDVGFNAIGVGIDTRSGEGPYGGAIIHVWFGEASDDTGTPKIVGTSRGDSIIGTEFADLVSAGDGNDNVNGGRGSDKLYGGSGDDRLYGKTGDDRLYGSYGDDYLSGYDGDDTLTGNSGADTLLGGDGDDRLYGKSGSDTLEGGSGDDYLSGYTGADVLVGDSGRDSLAGGSGDDRLYGKTGSDVLDGGSGDDDLSGYDGNDTLTGGSGRDELAGGRGADVFVFENAADGGTGSARDVIQDFVHDLDRIDLRAFDASGAENLTFIGRGAFSDTAGEIRQSGDILAMDSDGDGRSEFEIEIASGARLDADDFLL